MASLEGVQRVEGRPFSGKGVRAVPLFSAKEKENIDILCNFGHFGARKVPKYSKIAKKNSLLGSFSSF
jgi:hypothetical protein